MDSHMIEVIDAAEIPEKTKTDLKKLMEGHAVSSEHFEIMRQVRTIDEKTV